MSECKPVTIPSNLELKESSNETTEENEIIGSLMDLAVRTRLDIMHTLFKSI